MDSAPHRKGPVTLKQIAEITGLHVSTVSRVLRQDPPPDGWSESAQLIRATARELGYQPNPWAASLRTRRTGILGAVMPRLTDGVIATMFQGVQEAAEDAGYSVIMSSPADEPQALRKAAEMLAGRQVDGLLLSSLHRPGGEFVAALNLGATPLVLLNRHGDTDFPSVTGDDRRGGALVAEHLLELGHRSFGVVAGPVHASSAHDRVVGFLEALRSVGVEVPASRVIHSGFEVSGGLESARLLLGLADRPTAIFAVNDTAAIGILGVARDFGLQIPDDLSVVGFNDIPMVAQLPVPLTTVRTRPAEMGAMAVHKLLESIDGRLPTSVKLPVELIVRQSTTTPSAN